MWGPLAVLLCLGLGPAAAEPSLLVQFVADYTDYRAVSVVNLYVSRSSGRFSSGDLADMVMWLNRQRDRYITLHFLPMSLASLERIISSPTGPTEHVILSDDNRSVTFLETVHENGYLTEDYSWFIISETDVVRSRMAAHYLPVNSQLIIGEISRDPNGALAISLMEIYRLRADMEVKQISLGRWIAGTGMTSWVNGSIYERRQDWSGLELHITTAADPPFVEYYPPPVSDVGGYVGDIWKELANVMKFTYRITYTIDGQWGTLKDDGSWTGVVGMLQRKEVEVSVTDLSVTESRQKVIDYSSGLQSIRLRMFIKKPSALDVSWTTYLDVFDTPLWLLLGLTVGLGGAAMAAMYWVERRLGLRALSEGNFGWRDSLLHVYGALCQQGAEGLPDGLGTRFFFWLFYICMVTVFASYSAMLVSFLAVQTMVLPFEDVEGLLADGTYKLGILRGTSQLDYFRLSSNPVLRQVYERHVVAVPSNPEGFRRAMTEKFAYLDVYEVAVLATQDNCDIIDIKKDYFVHNFALAFQKDSPYRTFLNFQLSRLNELGLMSQLLSRWWHRSSTCEADALEGLGLPSVFSAFVLLAGGAGVGLLLALAEWLWARCRPRCRRRPPPLRRASDVAERGTPAELLQPAHVPGGGAGKRRVVQIRLQMKFPDYASIPPLLRYE